MNYLLLSQHKTGSRMLCNMLDGHPDLACPHEFLDVPAHTGAWREALASLEQRTGKRAIGHVQAKSATLDMLTDPGTKRFLLTRDPRLSALSFLRVEYEGPGKWEIPEDVFRAEVEKRAQQLALMSCHAEALISYEEITGGRHTPEASEAMSARLCAFFGVPFHPLKTIVRKSPAAYPTNWGALSG